MHEATRQTSQYFERQLVPGIKKGRYREGHPLDDLQYLECKRILKGDRFTAESNLDDFAKVVRHAAENAEVGFSRRQFRDVRPQIREVLFLDTEYFQLFNPRLSYPAVSFSKTVSPS